MASLSAWRTRRVITEKVLGTPWCVRSSCSRRGALPVLLPVTASGSATGSETFARTNYYMMITQWHDSDYEEMIGLV